MWNTPGMAVNIVVGVLGFLLIAVTMRDIFQSVVVPRAASASTRISRLQTYVLWAVWPRIALRYADPQKREDVLGAFAPFNMIALLVTWVVLVAVGFGLVFFALRGQLRPQPIDLPSALYFAGAALLTTGFGDIVPHSAFARFVAIAAGAAGLGIVAVVTSYLFSVFGAFQRREAYVVALAPRTGPLPSGFALLATHGYARLLDDLPNVLRQGQQWAAAVRQSQVAYPMLSYFRSGHCTQSWVGTLGCLLDASALILSAIDDVPHGQASLMLDVGRHTAADLAEHHRVRSPGGVGVERHEFDAACERLRHAGFALRDPSTAWQAFSHLRSAYAPDLNALALHFAIPPSPWIGDRGDIAS